MAQRVLRMPGSPYSLAAGFACGVAVSFTPLIGFHLVLAAVLAYLIRANVIASWAGTIFGNPWTFPFIFILLHKVGNYIIEMLGLSNWFFAGEDYLPIVSLFSIFPYGYWRNGDGRSQLADQLCAGILGGN